MKYSIASIALMALLTASSAKAAASIYESFSNFPDSTLTGNPGGTGLSGNWTSGTAAVQTTNLTYGALQTSGSAVIADAYNGSAARVDIGGTSLNGLTNDGGELWMSFLYRYGSGASGVRYAVGIGDSWTNNNGNLLDEDGGSVEQAIGVADYTDNAGRGAIPMIWDANTFDGGNINTNPTFVTLPTTDPGLTSGSQDNFGFIGTNNTTQLFVLHAQWGANGSTNDVITLYTPGTDLVLGSAVASYQAIVSQDSFDTLFFTANRDATGVLDEIRIGGSYADVTPVPEPSAIFLGSLSGLLLLLRRRR